MITYAGLRVVVTDAVFADHLMVERSALFCGREAFVTLSACVRNPRMEDFVSGPVHESLVTRRSAKVTILKPGMTDPLDLR